MKARDKNKISSVNLEEEYSQKTIPESSKKHWFYAGSVYAGLCAVIGACMGGGGLISGLTFSQAIIALFVGMAVLVFLFYIPLGKIGAEQGLNTYMIGESAFGKHGSNIATSLIISVLPSFVWYGLQVQIATQAIAAVIPMNKLIFNIVTVIMGLIFAIPAMFGITSMAWLNWVSIPVMLYVVIFGFTKAIAISGTSGLWSYTPKQNMGLFWGINLKIGMIVSGCAFVSDYTRWIRNSWKDVTYSGVIGIFPANTIMVTAGMVMSLTATSLGVKEPWNIAEVMMKLDMSAIAMIFVFLLQWTTCITAAYSSGLGLQKMFGGSRFYLTLLTAAVGILFAISGVVSHFIDFISTISSLIPPIIGVMVSDYYFVNNNSLKFKDGIYWPGIISALIGGIISWKLVFFIPAINGFILAGLCYYIYHKVLSLCISSNETASYLI